MEPDHRDRVERAVGGAGQNGRAPLDLAHQPHQSHHALLHGARQLAGPVRQVLNRQASERQRHHVRSRTHGDRHLTAGPRDLTPNLGSGVADAHHQDAAAYVGVRPPVRDAVLDSPGEPLLTGEARCLGIGDDPRRHDQRAGGEGASTRVYCPGAVAPRDPIDQAARFHGQLEGARVVTQILPELAARHEEGRGAGKRPAGETRHVLPGVEGEAVVEIRPGIAHRVAPLEHAMGQAVRPQLLGGGEAGGPATHNQHVGLLRHATARDETRAARVRPAGWLPPPGPPRP